MKIKIYTIAKKPSQQTEIMREIRQFGAEMEIINCFNSEIRKSQKDSIKSAQIAYGKEFEKYLGENNIALDINGKELDSIKFSEMLRNKSEVRFFIGGAFGFESSFLKKTQNISLSKLTFSHEVAKIVLCEQIFRALSILNNHPYHKGILCEKKN